MQKQYKIKCLNFQLLIGLKYNKEGGTLFKPNTPSKFCFPFPVGANSSKL